MTSSIFHRLVQPVVDPHRLYRSPSAYWRYLRDRRRYGRLDQAETLSWRDAYPQLWDRLPSSPFDTHYFHQDIWAAKCVVEHAAREHVDVGSRVDFVGFLTAVSQVTFVDLRPLAVEVENLTCLAGSILDLPFESQKLQSVSCLHVAEHVGLGRYGDQLDPSGTRRAAAELERVLAPGGQLLFSLPVGRSRVEFNAHRIHDARQVVDEMFPELDLVEFAGVDDSGVFARNRGFEELEGADYACGMFRFMRTR